MSDDKNKKDVRDRNQVAGNQYFEVDYLAQKLNVTRDQLPEAIKAVGYDRQRSRSISKKVRNEN